MQHFFYFLLAGIPLLSSSARAQCSSPRPEPDNSAWMDSVQQLALSRQLAAVQQRAWRDTALAPYSTPACRTPLSAARPGAAAPAAQPEPAWPHRFPLVYIVDGQPFYSNDAATIREFQHALRHGPIRQITLLRGTAAAALGGARAANGMVILSSRKERKSR